LILDAVVFVSALKATFEQIGVAAPGDANTDTSIATQDRILSDFSTPEKLIATLGSVAKNIAAYNTPERIVLSVSVARILAEIEAGNFLAIQRFIDTVGPDDVFVADVAKALSELAAASDLVSVAVSRPVADAGSAADAVASAFLKALTESPAATDTLLFLHGKTPAEQTASVSDLASLAPNKFSTDTAATSDQIDTRGVGKSISDVGALLDTHATDTQKPQQDAASIAANDLARAFSKSLYSLTNATDDVDGEASLLDDQEVQFVKNTVDVAAFADFIVLSKQYFRDFADTFASLDLLYLTLTRQLTDSASTSDLRTLLVAKERADVATTTDALALAGAASKSDIAIPTDIRYSALVKSRLDSASLTDTGSLRSQGYCDFTYFAEDYVGASRIF
jgi:hypothetical protein